MAEQLQATSAGRLRLGVNIDHVATVRNARGGAHAGSAPRGGRSPRRPAPTASRRICARIAGTSRDGDIDALMAEMKLPLNFEMAATDEMQAIALRHVPHAVCLVPERREERTTEGGLDVAADENRLAHFIAPLREAGCRVSLFVAADRRQIEAAARDRRSRRRAAYRRLLRRLRRGRMARATPSWRGSPRWRTFARALGLEVHAGHGLTYESVGPIAALPEVVELNIGHFLIGEAIFVGLDAAIRRMRALMDAARGAWMLAARWQRMIVGIGTTLPTSAGSRGPSSATATGSSHRCFTEIEQAKSDRRRMRAASYAKRWAAKEACSKALGTGLRMGIAWREMEVVNLADGSADHAR